MRSDLTYRLEMLDAHLLTTERTAIFLAELSRRLDEIATRLEDVERGLRTLGASEALQ